MTIAIGQIQERGLFDLVDDWLKMKSVANSRAELNSVSIQGLMAA